ATSVMIRIILSVKKVPLGDLITLKLPGRRIKRTRRDRARSPECSSVKLLPARSVDDDPAARRHAPADATPAPSFRNPRGDHGPLGLLRAQDRGNTIFLRQDAGRCRR